jgi:hypothetical protein
MLDQIGQTRDWVTGPLEPPLGRGVNFQVSVPTIEPISAALAHWPLFMDQMTNFTADFDRQAAGYSPDRLDALVWAATEQLVQPMAGYAIFEVYRRRAEALAAEQNQY